MVAGSSTVRKRSRRMATMPTFVSPWLSPTKPKDRKEYPPSFSKREIQDSAQAKKKTNSACGRAILPKSSSPMFYSFGESTGRGRQGLRKHVAGARRRPRLNCGAGPGHGPGRLRGRSEVCETAQAVWQNDQRISGHSIQARRHGHRNRSCPTAGVSRRVARRPEKPALHEGIEHGKAVRQRGWRAGGERSGADFRRLRFHQGLSCGEILSRLQTLHHRRRHQRNSAHGNCASNFGETLTWSTA